MPTIGQRIAGELNVQEWQVKAAIDLIDGGATVPFIARYRKEVTGTLDDAQLRTLDERLRYLRELEDRRKSILDGIRQQGKLTDELAAQIAAADTKARLEDLYLPYKPKRRTKAQIAREAGLEPLADLLLKEPHRDPRKEAAAFVDAGRDVAAPEAALEGARAILVERFAESAELLGALREAIGSAAASRPNCATARRPTGRSSPITSISPSPSRSFPPTASWRSFAARRRRSSIFAWRRTRAARSRATSAPMRAARRSPSASRTRAAPATPGCWRPCAGPGARSCGFPSNST
jgi:hypothetical protein